MIKMYLVGLFLYLVTQTHAQSKDLFLRKNRPLPIDGHWSEWGPWSKCYLNDRSQRNFYPALENYFLQGRNRSCTSPRPIHGGKDCEMPSHRYKQCSCMNPLGMATKVIKDSQIKSSAFLPGFPPSQGRLHANFTGWCSKYKAGYLKNVFLEIDFKGFVNVGALRTLANKEGRILSYKVEYSLNGRDWKGITSTKSKIFTGNIFPNKVKQSNLSNHKVMRFLRVLPIRSTSKTCMKLEILGCVFTCGNAQAESFGKIVARSRADMDQNCLWRIEVLNTTSLTFDFTIFDVLCAHGYLDFYAGESDYTNSKLLKRICLANRDEEIPLFKTNNNIVWLNFVSNSSDIEDSFNIQYSSECKQNLNLVYGIKQDIKSPNYPENYFGNLDCSWTIDTLSYEHKSTIDITVNDFNVESSSNLCSDDVVTIKYYKNNEEITLGEFCNEKKPKKFYKLDADKVHIIFKTDPIISQKGFNISIVSGVITTPTIKYQTVSTPTKDYTSNSTEINPIHKKKKSTDDGGSHWTIIIISSFSALVILLLVAVIGMNIRRYVNNRNELNAQCAKVAAKNKEKQLKENKIKLHNHNDESSSLLSNNRGQIQVVFTPNHAKQTDTENNHKTKDVEMHDNVDSEFSHLMPPDNAKDSDTNQDELQDADLDSSPTNVENTVLQFHSPLRSPSPNLSGSNKISSDDETCV